MNWPVVVLLALGSLLIQQGLGLNLVQSIEVMTGICFVAAAINEAR